MSVKYVGPVGLRAGLLVMWTPSRSTKIENAHSELDQMKGHAVCNERLLN